MISNTAVEGTPSSSKRRFQFSLLFLFVITTAICLVLTWWYWPRPVAVTTLLMIDSSAPNSYSAMQHDALQLFRRKDVLRAVFRDPEVLALKLVQAQQNPMEWWRERLSCDFPQQGEIMSVSLLVPPHQASAVAKLLDRHVAIFIEAITSDERQRRQQQIVTARSEYDALRKRIENASLTIASLKNKRGNDDPEVKLMRMESDVLVKRAAELSLRMRLLEDKLLNPPITLVQPAVGPTRKR